METEWWVLEVILKIHVTVKSISNQTFGNILRLLTSPLVFLFMIYLFYMVVEYYWKWKICFFMWGIHSGGGHVETANAAIYIKYTSCKLSSGVPTSPRSPSEQHQNSVVHSHRFSWLCSLRHLEINFFLPFLDSRIHLQFTVITVFVLSNCRYANFAYSMHSYDLISCTGEEKNCRGHWCILYILSNTLEQPSQPKPRKV